MSDETDQKSTELKRGEGRKLAREERQAKALRDNLRRRKQQNRSRGEQVVEPSDMADTDIVSGNNPDENDNS
jgi:hypothetical protein